MALYGALPAVGYVIGVGAFTVVGYDGYAPFVAAAGALALGLFCWCVAKRPTLFWEAKKLSLQQRDGFRGFLPRGDRRRT